MISLILIDPVDSCADLIDDGEEKGQEADVDSVASEVSTGVPDWPDWQPAMVTGRELEDTDEDLPIVVHDPQIWRKVVGPGRSSMATSIGVL